MNFNFTPLTIETNNQNQTSQSQMWSPFSTPSLSPFNQLMSPQFQYSNSPTSRPIFRSTQVNSPMSPLRINCLNNNMNRTVIGSPRQVLFSPSNQQENLHPSNFSPRSLPKRSDQVDMSEAIRQAAVNRAMGGRVKVCTFCKTNGESEEIFTCHTLKDANGNVTCPILRNYSCPECGASGEKVHTKKYCPILQKRLRLEMLSKMTTQ